MLQNKLLVVTEERRALLGLAGVPSGMLDALSSGAVPEALSSIVRQPESAYWYYERYPELIQRYGAIQVVPFAQGPNGDEFFDWVVFSNGGRFALNHLESGWEDIGESILALALTLATRSYEFNDQLSIQEIAYQFESVGLPNVLVELERLEQLTT